MYSTTRTHFLLIDVELKRREVRREIKTGINVARHLFKHSTCYVHTRMIIMNSTSTTVHIYTHMIIMISVCTTIRVHYMIIIMSYVFTMYRSFIYYTMQDLI